MVEIEENEKDENIIPFESFDFTKPHELGTILYSCNSDITNLSIETWIVTGHNLLNGSNHRNVNCLLMSYPISKFVQFVKHSSTNQLFKVFTSKEKAISYNKEKAYIWYHDIIDKIDKQK